MNKVRILTKGNYTIVQKEKKEISLTPLEKLRKSATQIIK